MPAGDKVKAGPPTPGATDTSYPGVPAGYTVKRQPSGGGIIPSKFKSFSNYVNADAAKPPRYDETWILRPLQQNWSPEQIADLQQKMVNAGLLKGGYRRGVWDPASQVAYKKLIEHANQSGSNLTQSLKTYADAPEEEDPTERAPLVVTLTNPADLSETARAVARRVIGRTLSDEEAGRFVAAYQSMEKEAQAAAHKVSDPSGAGGTVTAAPSAEIAATDRIKDEMPQEAADYGYVGRFNEFMQLLGGD